MPISPDLIMSAAKLGGKSGIPELTDTQASNISNTMGLATSVLDNIQPTRQNAAFSESKYGKDLLKNQAASSGLSQVANIGFNPKAIAATGGLSAVAAGAIKLGTLADKANTDAYGRKKSMVADYALRAANPLSGLVSGFKNLNNKDLSVKDKIMSFTPLAGVVQNKIANKQKDLFDRSQAMRQAQELKAQSNNIYGFQKGGIFKPFTDPVLEKKYQLWKKTAPYNFYTTDDFNDYNLRGYWENLGSPRSWTQGVKENDLKREDDGMFHGRSVNSTTGEFLKPKTHPSIKMELEWFNSKDPEAVKYRKENKLDTTGTVYKYVSIKEKGGKIGCGCDKESDGLDTDLFKTMQPRAYMEVQRHIGSDVDGVYKESDKMLMKHLAKQSGGTLRTYLESNPRVKLMIGLKEGGIISKLYNTGGKIKWV